MKDLTKKISQQYPDCVFAQEQNGTLLYIRTLTLVDGTVRNRVYRKKGAITRCIMILSDDDLVNFIWSQNKNLFEFCEVWA